MSRIHFIGVGKMGLPMACHLAGKSHDLTVSDCSDAAISSARQRGLAVLPLPQGLAQAEVVFSSLPDDASLQAVTLELAQHARPGALYVDTSTVSAQASERVARVLAAHGIDYLRCPVSGNSPMAESAQLTVLASGPRHAYDRIEPLLKALGPTQFYLGDGEQARVMKLVINLMVIQTFSMLGEGFAIGEASGLSWESMWQVVAASAVASPLVKVKAESLGNNDFTATFTVNQMQKDVGLILEQARAAGLPATHTLIASGELARAVDSGWSAQDYAAIMKLHRPAS